MTTSSDDKQNDIGMYGLAVMGQNFALNFASNGYRVSVTNRSKSPERISATLMRANSEGYNIDGFSDASEFVLSLRKPRKVIILVQAGQAVDETIGSLSPYLEVFKPKVCCCLFHFIHFNLFLNVLGR